MAPAFANRLRPRAGFDGQAATAGSLRLGLACQTKLRSSEGWSWHGESNTGSRLTKALHRHFAMPAKSASLKRAALKMDKRTVIPLRIRSLIRTRLHDCPSNVWTFTMSNSK